MTEDDEEGAGEVKGYASSFDVARRAGVSRSAVSRTFTEGASVSPKTREKVLSAAAELGYSPSLFPKMMLTRKSALIALVIGALDHPDYAAVVELLASSIQEMGSRLLLFSVKDDQYIDEVISTILPYRVDAIISALAMRSIHAAQRCAKMNVPVVLFNAKVRNSFVGSICSDNVTGGREIASLLIKRGARRFGYIGGPKDNLSNEERFAGYVGRLMEEGISNIVMATGDFRFQSGYDAICEMMSGNAPPDAIFCANDLMALGAMEGARSRLGLRIPEDLMIAGFDDVPMASWASIGLTTVRQDAGAMVNEALEVLSLLLTKGSPPDGIVRIVSSPVIERATTLRKEPAIS